MLTKVLKKMNFKKKYEMTMSEEELSRKIHEEGIKEALPKSLPSLPPTTHEQLVHDICQEMRRDLIPCSQKKIRDDPVAAKISKLDFYHNYGVELPTD